MGTALVATRPIPAGTILWALCEFDIVLDRPRVADLSRAHREVLDRYAFISPTGDCILQWDLGRFGNHSCGAICHSVRYDVEIAVRDVAAGEQITTEYGNLNRDFQFECSCGSPNCRTFIRHDDSMRHGERWDAEVASVLPLFHEVEQPLAAVLSRRVEALAILEGRRPQGRSRDGYCPPHLLPDLSPPPELGLRFTPIPARTAQRSRYSVTMPISHVG
ncbi:MAG TPA: SET domain-containing protein-lysine N-methyltransferase [Kofleriaceae bacterium]|jgi:hypothetical protein|nr:SET domain-containing protein-lysine N-methyltransferase [Kofleriaceae bacterium]